MRQPSRNMIVNSDLVVDDAIYIEREQDSHLAVPWLFITEVPRIVAVHSINAEVDIRVLMIFVDDPSEDCTLLGVGDAEHLVDIIEEQMAIGVQLIIGLM